MQSDHVPKQKSSIGELVPFDSWLESLDKTRGTGWRWRKMGIVRTENIFGKVYISKSEIIRFESRVTAGEFAQAPAGAAQR